MLPVPRTTFRAVMNAIANMGYGPNMKIAPYDPLKQNYNVYLECPDGHRIYVGYVDFRGLGITFLHYPHKRDGSIEIDWKFTFNPDGSILFVSDNYSACVMADHMTPKPHVPSNENLIPFDEVLKLMDETEAEVSTE